MSDEKQQPEWLNQLGDKYVNRPYSHVACLPKSDQHNAGGSIHVYLRGAISLSRITQKKKKAQFLLFPKSLIK